MRAPLLILVMILVTIESYAAILMNGNAPANSDQTFTFTVQQHVEDTVPKSIGSNVFVAAAPGQSGLNIAQQFAISVLNRDSTTFVPLAPQTAIFNGAKGVNNPLYDQSISYMSYFNGEGSALNGSNDRLALITDTNPNTIYFLNRFTPDGNNIEVITAFNVGSTMNNIPDANGAVTSGILGVESPAPFIFAAVKPNAGNFGAPGSGVAVCQVGSLTLTNGTFTGLLVMDGPTLSPAFPSGNRATPLDITSSALTINDNLTSIGQVVDMHWFPQVGRLYVALQVTGGAAPTDGARAIAVGRLVETTTVKTDESGKEQTVVSNTAFVFDQIAPDSCFTAGVNNLVGTIGSNAQISINKIRSMYTTTGLPYLICVGGVGSPSATSQSVFAVPIVRLNNTLSLNGTIANKNSAPSDFFAPDNLANIFVTRGVTTPATTPSDMPLQTDPATMIDNGSLLNGPISDIYVANDTVFVTVQNPTSPQLPGIFYSQAMFAQNGVIQSWTTWRRAAGTVSPIAGANFDPITDLTTYLTTNNSGGVTVVNRTQWATGDTDGLQPFYDACAAAFPLNNGGIQGLQDFVVTSTSLQTSTPGLKDISLLIATGLNGIVFAETSYSSGGVITPIRGSALGTVTTFSEGTITQTFPVSGSKMVAISGGVLNNLGPIDTVQVARDGFSGSNGYIFVGGIGGVAVLSNADGSGWNATTGLSDGLSGLTAGMTFKQFGTYSFVRKIINDDQYLYILTNKQLDRIDLTQGNPGLGQFTAKTIAIASDLISPKASFLDAVVSGQLAVLATSGGLYSVANGYGAQTMGDNNAGWQYVNTPEGAGPVRQLFAITQTGRDQDIARSTNGGLLFALSAQRGLDQAKIFRFAIAQATTSNVSSTTVQKLNDLFVEDMQSYFASYGEFRNLFATDGAAYFGGVSKQLENNSTLSVLFSRSGLQTGSRFLSNRIIPVDISQATILSAMLINSGTGSWLLGTDDGLRINE